MAKQSVPAPPFSSNDISSLAQCFQVAFTYFSNHNSPFIQEYLMELNTLVGLGLTAALADGECVFLYCDYLRAFLDHRDFKTHPEKIGDLSLVVANMVSWATRLFSTLDYPGYYEYFASSVKKTVGSKVVHLYGNPEEMRRLLTMILQRSPI